VTNSFFESTFVNLGEYLFGQNKDFIEHFLGNTAKSATYDLTHGENLVLPVLNLLGSTLNIVDGDLTVTGLSDLISSTINIASGSSFTAIGAAILHDTKIVLNGGTLRLAGPLDLNLGTVVDFSNNPHGTLILDKSVFGNTTSALTIANYAYGDVIEIASDGSGALHTAYDAATRTLTVYNSSDRAVLTMHNFTMANSTQEPTARYSNGYLMISCFLADSMIETPEGPRAVQDLSVGDQVVTYNRQTDASSVAALVWTGRTHMTVRTDLADDVAGYPVRVLKDAFADGVPGRDMLITPEHCLFFEGKFVPARMLVNGRSVFYDRSITSYDYFHVETEQHSVITADGMLTESYLDTGNRNSFRQEGDVFRLGTTVQKTWARDAAAPLCVARDVVEPIFRQTQARAIVRDVTPQTTPAVLTKDSDLHLVTNKGQVLRMAREANGHAMFMIPSGITTVKIVSRTSRPSDTIGPFVDDRRSLGVLVGDLTLFDSGATTRIDAHLLQADLDGWDVQEASPCRWTNGNATLALPARQADSLGILAVQILAAGPYLVTDSVVAADVRTA